jgi:hypothetical protein
MPWAAGSYSKGNNGTGGWTGDASLGIGIEAGRHDTQDNDFATGINQCINKDGSNAFTGDPNLGGFKPTNLAAGTAAAPAICAGNDVNTGVFAPAADTWAVATNGSERIRVSSSGVFDVKTTGTQELVTINRYSNDSDLPIFAFKKSRSASLDGNTIVQSGDSLGAIAFGGANGTGYNYAASIIAVVDGTPGASNDMPGRLEFRTTADGAGSTTERMRIDSTGNVAIGATTASDVRLFSKGSSTSTHYSILGQNSSSVTCFGVRNDGYIFTGTAANSPFNNTAAVSANLHVAGDGLLYRATSSLKYKKDIENMFYGLDKVLALRPVTYKGKAEVDGDKIYAGLIAEEVDAAGLPEFVQYAQDGSPDALNYGNMVALAFKAIQELNTKVEALQARVAELEGA